MRTRRSAAVIIALAMTIAACSSDDDNASETSATAPATVATASVDTLDASDTTTDDTTTGETTTGDTTTGDTNAGTTEVSTSGGSDTTTDDTLEVEARIDQVRDALETGNFSAMLQALSLSGLADEINDREVTVLAPTNDAFTELSRDEVSDLLTNPSEVDNVLKRHILDELYTFEELSNQTEVTTLAGDTLAVSNTNGELTIDGAVVTEPSDGRFDGTGGQELAVFAIDRVLLEGP